VDVFYKALEDKIYEDKLKMVDKFDRSGMSQIKRKKIRVLDRIARNKLKEGIQKS